MIVAVLERKDRSVADVGLKLAEGGALVAAVQSLLVSEQTAGWMESQLLCDPCGSMLAHKDPGAAPDERVTVISDDAGEFSKAVDGSHLARGRIWLMLHRDGVLGCEELVVRKPDDGVPRANRCRDRGR